MFKKTAYRTFLEEMEETLKTSDQVSDTLLKVKAHIKELKSIQHVSSEVRPTVLKLEQGLINELENQVKHHKNLLNLLYTNQKISTSLFDKAVKSLNSDLFVKLEDKTELYITYFYNELDDVRWIQKTS